VTGIKVMGECSDLLEEYRNGIWVPVLSRWRRNLVVDVAAKAFASGLSGLAPGILYHALGQGAGGAWDPFVPNTPAALPGDLALVGETFRKVVGSTQFVTEFAGTSDAGGTTTTMVDAALTQSDDFFNGDRLIMTGGANAGEDRQIIDFIDASNTVVIDPGFPFPFPIGAGQTYEINHASPAPTSKIEISTTFNAGEGTGDLREHGLFGVDATGAANSGVLINEIRHPIIVKVLLSQLTRVMRLKIAIV
jgi:hypothetical protein